MTKSTLWRRWGRGSCEGYTLAIGAARDLHGIVSREPPLPGLPPTWRATIGGIGSTTFAEREAAMAHVEREIRIAMEDILRDWQAYCAAQSKVVR